MTPCEYCGKLPASAFVKSTERELRLQLGLPALCESVVARPGGGDLAKCILTAHHSGHHVGKVHLERYHSNGCTPCFGELTW